MKRHSNYERKSAASSIFWFAVLVVASVGIVGVCENSIGAEFRGRTVDEKGEALSGVKVMLWTQSGRHLVTAHSDALGNYLIQQPNRRLSNDGPLELMYEVKGRHIRFIGQISGSSQHDVTVVLMREDGPNTYERVYDSLADYERLFYVINGASTSATIRSKDFLRNEYQGRILSIPNPDGSRLRDNQFRAKLRPDQMDLIRRKRQQVLNTYGI